jgi:hypothetical protein
MATGRSYFEAEAAMHKNEKGGSKPEGKCRLARGATIRAEGIQKNRDIKTASSRN